MPKKKAKGPDLSAMTEAERAIYMEKQAQAERLMKAKKQEMLSTFLKEKLRQESKATALNTHKLTFQWRQIMRNVKSRELKRDIDILAQSFERVVDRKDSIIKALIKDLNEADEQYMVAMRSHNVNVDKMMTLQESRLRSLENEFKNELEFIRKEFQSEEAFVNKNYSAQLDDLKDIFVAIETHITSRNSELNLEYNNRKDELRNKSLEDKHSLRITLETKVNSLWAEFKEQQKNYNSSTEERRAVFETLKAKDEKSRASIEAQMKRILKLQETINGVKNRMGNSGKEYDAKNRRLRLERERLLKNFNLLKTEAEKLRRIHNSKLTDLAMVTDETVKKLNSLHELAQGIITLGERCRALETEEEKVLPFYASTLDAQEETALKEALQPSDTEKSSKEDPSILKIFERFLPMENFWKRFNKVQLERIALIKERELLQQQNMELRGILKKYLDGISVTNASVVDNRSLLIVNSMNL